MDKKQLYIEKTLHLFLQKGIKNVTMSEVTQALNVSSKTLYKMFDGKTGLVLTCIRLHKYQMSEMAQRIIDEKDENVLDAIISIHDAFLGEVVQIDPAYFNDIAFYYPEIWETESYFDFKYTKGLMMRGIKQGLFHKNLDVELAVDTIVLLIRAMIEHKDLQGKYKQNYEPLYNSMLLPYLKGLCTMHGLQKLREYHKAKLQAARKAEAI
ncbi:TetR/AcrR family transcriptional regulator [Microscilla marina]|uniref:Transcriptional regulator, TetR family protein n=1 Tax=Microscilla marina ATCC 23134 TaxID=313606 RepID=A1ZUH2_MICM2|nr:helix-turn-helix domain-containing protein [Microscilla marina]EAY25991.1 transcriptional regulator, TetR family protein [Microscilla marina ATCC 23134]